MPTEKLIRKCGKLSTATDAPLRDCINVAVSLRETNAERFTDAGCANDSRPFIHIRCAIGCPLAEREDYIHASTDTIGRT